MTKETMLARFYRNGGKKNYEEAQLRIMQAMRDGEKYCLLPREEYGEQFKWYATSDTISRLVRDGFKVNEVWQPAEYWSIEWGY